jgi:hypothetical protein
MEQQAELVRPEAVTTEPIGKAGALEVIDPLLGRTALHVPVVEGQRRRGARGDDEAHIRPLLEHLGLVDDAPRMHPGVRSRGQLTR